MKFFWNRPKPKFWPGQLVAMLPREGLEEARYMLIECRRWVKPNGEIQKQWVYDGLILAVHEGRLVFRTGGTCFFESMFIEIPG
jgi:hypothetical protein